MARPDLHVIFGAGQVGQPLAELLIDAGKHVRVIRRSSPSAASAAEVVLGDAADRTFCIDAASNAATIYHCMNPPYDAKIWADLVPRYMGNLIAAAAASAARLVVLDNVYMLGRPAGNKLSEDTPLNPCSRKGEIRARAVTELFDAHKRGDVVAATARASDYYGPGGTLTGLGDFFWPRALAGRTAYSPVPLDAVHTYHYIPDVAAGLATLGCAGDDAFGRVWMMPCQPAETMRQLIARLSRAATQELKVAQLPRWLLKALGLGMPVMREVTEMLYQWDEPFVVDDRQFRARFGNTPASLDDAAAATIAWARRHYAASVTPAR